MANNEPRTGPLQGLRVLDIATIIAGPIAATFLADFGAEVVKVEMPKGGDGLRALRPHKDGIPLWWKVTNRNKKCATLDLRTEKGAEIIKKMVPQFDVLVENFRPGTIERWGIGPDVLQAINPNLTILRVTAFGQTGPYSSRPGFARVGEAMSGFQSISGEPDGAPLHVGYPIADAVTGMFGAMGILVALMELRMNPDSPGQVIDVSLAESMFRITEFLAIEYDQLGEVRTRTGNRNPYAAPGNVYKSKDGRWITVPASTQALFERLIRTVGKPEYIEDPRFATNVERLAHAGVLEEAIGEWIGQHDAVDACRIFDENSVANAPVKTIDELFEDPHYKAYEMIVPVPDDELGEVRMQAVTPRLSRTPGKVTRAGPAHGADTDDVYGEYLGLSADDIAALREEGVI